MGSVTEMNEARGLPQPVVDVVRRCRRTYRRRLLAFAGTSSRRADLVVACPAAAIALVDGSTRADARAAAITRLEQGAPLKTVMDQLGLPFWYRRIPPEAILRAPMPSSLSEEGNRTVAGRLPADPVAAGSWLAHIWQAEAWSHERFALWVSGLAVDWSRVRPERAVDLRPLAAFAWFSGQLDLEGGRMVVRTWHDRLGLAKAADNAAAWLRLVHAATQRRAYSRDDTWLRPGRLKGHTFVPLLSSEALDEEGRVLNHCADTYVGTVEQGRARLFSIRRGESRVATLEIQPHPNHPGRPIVVQLRGRDNAEVPDDIWRLVFLWLAKQRSYDLPVQQQQAGPMTPDEARWERLFRPYLLSVGEDELIAMRPTATTLTRLHACLDRLERLAR